MAENCGYHRWPGSIAAYPDHNIGTKTLQQARWQCTTLKGRSSIVRKRVAMLTFLSWLKR